ncbi:hypothetical protein [Anaerosalibacter massiliensis]|uniref:hypothetical protein n=1 Tax=Anaerosalibacter massiliensis TaxID=1347392 RepID=UPI00164E89E9|nr:hypothetical protein [Anaerosalibacter massiliensis]
MKLLGWYSLLIMGMTLYLVIKEAALNNYSREDKITTIITIPVLVYIALTLKLLYMTN